MEELIDMTEEKLGAPPPAKINQEEYNKILAECEEFPEETGFAKMFAHNSAPFNVFVVGVQDK